MIVSGKSVHVYALKSLDLTKVTERIKIKHMRNCYPLLKAKPPLQLFGDKFRTVAHCMTPPWPPSYVMKILMLMITIVA